MVAVDEAAARRGMRRRGRRRKRLACAVGATAWRKRVRCISVEKGNFFFKKRKIKEMRMVKKTQKRVGLFVVCGCVEKRNERGMIVC